MNFTIRTAQRSDVPYIESLINESVQGLAAEDYSKEQIDGALKKAWGVDTQLIDDSTYFVVHAGTQLIGCGGWSFRETLFGNDSEVDRNPKELDPMTDAAKIRAFFVKPSHARTGIGSALMKKCEDAACAKGFHRLELMATLPGQRLYSRHGFEAAESIEYPLGGDLFITFVPMKKDLEG